MSTFNTPTKKIDVTVTFTFNKIINVPARWTGEQIDEWTENMDLDPFYESTPDNIDIDWRMHKERKDAE